MSFCLTKPCPPKLALDQGMSAGLHQINQILQEKSVMSGFTWVRTQTVESGAEQQVGQVEHAYVYVFVREDLSPPQQAVQSAHAVIEATKTFNLERLPDHPSVVILSAKNENRLNRVRKYLIDQGILHVQFFEPDMDNQLTAIATQPLFGSRREVLRKYQLLDTTPDAQHTRYAAEFPDGYYRWSGDCGRSPDRTGSISDANLFDTPEEARWYRSDAKIIPVKVCYHIGGAIWSPM